MKNILLLLILILACSGYAIAQNQTEDIDNTADPIVSLREEIEGAATPSDRIRLQLKLADLLASTGKKTEALAELQLIANSNAFDPVGFYNLGNSFARLGEPEAAIAAYRTAIEQRKGRYSRAYNNLGVLLLRTGKWEEAQDALLSALKLEGFRYAEASYNLGRVYSARGQNDLAFREWRRALVVDPDHDAAKQALARVRTEERIALKPAAPKGVENKQASSVVGPAPSTTASAHAPALALDSTSFDYLQRARDASERGKMIEAVENFRRVLKLQGGYFPPANLELGFVLVSLKRHDEALVELLQVAQRDGARFPISYFHLARLYELKGDLKLAEESFAKAVAASPGNAQFLLDLSRVREKLGDFKGALDAMEQFLKLSPEKTAWSNDRLAELRRKAGN